MSSTARTPVSTGLPIPPSQPGRRLRPFLLACCLGAGVLAQTPTVTCSVPTAGSLVAQFGASQQSTTLPAGPAAALGSLSAGTPTFPGHAVTAVTWNIAAGSGSFDFFLTTTAEVVGGSGLADSGAVSFLVSVAFPTPTSVSLSLDHGIQGDPGNPLATGRIDVDDDGTLEVSEISPPGPSFVQRMVGPTGLLIRCTVRSTVTIGGGMVSFLHLHGTPGATSIQPLLYGCTGIALNVMTRFDGNLDFAISLPAAPPSVAVFGLATQPLFLGTEQQPFGALLPCVLMPRPDLVVFLPTAAVQTLPIPAVARPLVLYAQGVVIGPSSFTTTQATTVFAY